MTTRYVQIYIVSNYNHLVVKVIVMAKTEMEALGEDTDGMAESTAKLQKEMLGLTGIDIMDGKDQFKSTYQILDELAYKWQDLTDIQQASVTEMIGGKRQGQVISALLNNFDIARESITSAENSEGSAARELSNYQQGVQFSIDRLKASWQEFSTTAMSTDVFKGVLDSANSLLGIVTQITGLGGGLGGAGLLGAIFGTGSFLKNLD